MELRELSHWVIEPLNQWLNDLMAQLQSDPIKKMASLFDTLKIRGLSLRNRIGISPMCQYSAHERDGMANDWHFTHLGARAIGGAALVIAEATAVEARGRISPFDLGLWQDEQIEPLARIIAHLKTYGAVAGIQIAHAGRKAGTGRPWDGGHPLNDAEGGWEPVAPSAIAFNENYRTPHALILTDIAQVQQAFVDAARRAVQAGFDVIELHGAHGYLIHSFLSPIANHRTDHYGGSFENRTRFVREIAERVRAIVPEQRALFTRLSCTDWIPDAWDIEQSIELSIQLKAIGVDMIDCSSGGIAAGVQIPAKAGYQVPLAEAIHKAGVPTAAVGLISEPQQANAIIQDGQADVVLIARESLRDPHWPLRAAIQLGAPLPVPPQYARGYA